MSLSQAESDLRSMVGEIVSRKVNDLYFQADGMSGPVSDAVKGGIPAGAAIKAAARIIVRRRGCCCGSKSGMGDAVTDAIKSGAEIDAVKQARDLVSPWLWVFSVVGFGMAALNSHRIAKIYGGWRAGQRAVKRGVVPARRIA